MVLRVRITNDGLTPGLSDSGIAALKKRALGVLGAKWHDDYSLAKFTPKAARKYNYGRRKTKNVRTGESKFSRNGRIRSRGGYPLLWSGKSRELSKIRTIKPTQHRVRVTSPINVFNFWPNAKNPDLNLREEYTKVLPSEMKKLTSHTEKYIRQEFKHGKRNIRIFND